MSIGQGMGPNLLARLIGAMHLIRSNTIWYNIYGHATTWLWNRASPNTYLLEKKAQGIKIMQPWMCGSWKTFVPNFVIMNRRQLLGLRGTQTWNGASSKLFCGTPKVFKSTLVELTSSHILQLIGMITWGVGSIPFNV